MSLINAGWESGNQYVYRYVGRSVAGIYKLKRQNAVIELQCRVTVQSIDDNNIIVKVGTQIQLHFCQLEFTI